MNGTILRKRNARFEIMTRNLSSEKLNIRKRFETWGPVWWISTVRTKIHVACPHDSFFYKNSITDNEGIKMSSSDKLSLNDDMNASIEHTINTIEIMENTSLAVDPRHFHAFQRVSGSFLLGFLTYKCSICDGRLGQIFRIPNHLSGLTKQIGLTSSVDTVDDTSGKNSSEVVKCVACGIYVHRECLVSSLSNKNQDGCGHLTPCAVNQPLIEQSMMSEQEGLYGDNNFDADTPKITDNEEISQSYETDNEIVSSPTINGIKDSLVINKNTSTISSFDGGEMKQELVYDKSEKTEDEDFGEPEHLPQHHPHVDRDHTSTAFTVDTEEQPRSSSLDSENIWTSSGPPSHWANPESLLGLQIPPTAAEAEHGEITEQITSSKESVTSEASVSPIHYLEHSFSLFSRTLQDNLAAFSTRTKPQTKIEQSEEDKSSSSHSTQSTNSSLNKDDLIEKDNDGCTIQSDEPPSSLIIKEQTLNGNAAYNAFQKIKQTPSNLTAASLAGGIVGGVAGLYIAGPAGAFAGMRVGQACGVLGVITEGTLNVGVLAVSAAAAYKAKEAASKHGKKLNDVRMLTIGEEGMKRKMMLVRPNVIVSDDWEDICLRIRREWHGLKTQNNNETKTKDEDIVSMNENEIDFKDKILLLVSRSLNDKNSLPGYVYRGLIKEFRKRSENKKETEQSFEGETSLDSKSEYYSPRDRRQDTHGVIKFVTGTLLEIRPGFASSPALTEMSASAVEGLVFGELYDEVFEEIIQETKEKDDALKCNIHVFHQKNNSDEHQNQDNAISPKALKTLNRLCEAHSPADKLACCVEFLEMISTKHFSLESTESQTMGADTLLKLVCQHIIVSKIPRIHAENLFLEEFARDEQLLKGKEGYALVTLQAALHFLSSKQNFDSEIFSSSGLNMSNSIAFNNE